MLCCQGQTPLRLSFGNLCPAGCCSQSHLCFIMPALERFCSFRYCSRDHTGLGVNFSHQEELQLLLRGLSDMVTRHWLILRTLRLDLLRNRVLLSSCTGLLLV